MSDERTDPPGAGRCPECRARVRPGQSWCTLCNTILPDGRPDAADAPPGAVAESGDPGAGDPVALVEPTPWLEQPAPEQPAPEQPALRQPAGPGPAPEPGEIDVLLARLSASESGITGALGALTPGGGPATRVALACGAGLVLTGLLLGGLTLFGSLL